MQTVGNLAALQPLCSLDAKVVDVPVFVPPIHYISRVGRKFGCAGPHAGVVPETLGSEPYLAAVLGCGPNHISFLGGFDTRARTTEEIRSAAEADQWALQPSVQSDTPLPEACRLISDSFHRSQGQLVGRTIMLRMREEAADGQSNDVAIRLCIWAGRLPQELVPEGAEEFEDAWRLPWLPEPLHLVPIQELLDIRSGKAWGSLALRHMVCDSIGAFLRMADGGQRFPQTIGIRWPPVADRVVVADSALGLSGQTFLLVLKALGATQVMRMRSVCRNFDTVIGQQLKTRRWVAHDFVWKPQAFAEAGSVTLWRVDGSAGWLLDALQEERQKLTWLLLHLVRATWDLCDQDGTPFFMSRLSATGGLVPGTATAAGGRYLWLHLQEAERDRRVHTAARGAEITGAARLSELRASIVWMIQEFYERLTEAATRERLRDCPRGGGRDGRQAWGAWHRRERRPNRLQVAVQILIPYFAYPTETEETREAEGRAARFGQPASVVMPRVTRLAMVQAVVEWLWHDLRTLEGGLLLSRIVQQYVLHDLLGDMQGLEDRLPMLPSETEGERMLTARRASATLAGSHDCPLCLWPQVTMGPCRCACAEPRVEPSPAWSLGPLFVSTSESLDAWRDERDSTGWGPRGRFDPEGGPSFERIENGASFEDEGIWGSGSPMTIRLIYQDEIRRWPERLWGRAAGLGRGQQPPRLQPAVITSDRRSIALRCGASGCREPATSACTYAPSRCTARSCGRGCMEALGGPPVVCRCPWPGASLLSGPPAADGIEGGWPLDVTAQTSAWGPGTVTSRLGPMRLWVEATRHGCCVLPDGWGAGRLPHAMEQVVRRWEEERAQRAGRRADAMFCARRSAAAPGDLWAGYRGTTWGQAAATLTAAGAVGPPVGPGAPMGGASATATATEDAVGPPMGSATSTGGVSVVVASSSNMGEATMEAEEADTL